MKSRTLIGIYAFLSLVGIGFELLGVSVVQSLTPAYLLLTTALLIYTAKLKNWNFALILLLNGFIGFIIEVIGVKTGLVFGDYLYGGTLGPSLLGVPLLLIVLWAIVPWISFSIAQRYRPALIVSGFIAVLYDIVLEHFAVRYDLWQWEGGIPLSNFIAWFCITFGLSFILTRKKVPVIPLKVAISVLCIHILFFSAMILLY